jgi:hypothetical protein
MAVRLPLILVFIASVGCEQLASDQDKQAKEKIVGHWLREADSDIQGALLREHIVHSPDGKFQLERMVAYKDGAVTREHESGSWFVTANLYKMRTEYQGREPLPPSRQLYSTCTIQTLTAQELICSNEVDKWTKRQRRVSQDFRL